VLSAAAGNRDCKSVAGPVVPSQHGIAICLVCYDLGFWKSGGFESVDGGGQT